ncbi:hypothetical protein [Mycobacterium sp. shizuoka-1]|uniref:hypothetical protein n=1 Tax=Mycobacterium sp. shizuoka-1 TaxID=2039281 RepID=UPI000C05EEB0|nr:hypothetical protein [Mycobacterium sp. shizuoka-1]GAY18286.1 hypothetical protein MSZK_50120 [Mycobacterium sp. shizuoka-1]
MSITASPHLTRRIAGRILPTAAGIAIAALTLGAAPAVADPGPGGPGGPCGFQDCQGPGQRGPDGPPPDRGGPGPADWRGGPGGGPGGPQWRGDDGDRRWRGIDQGRFDHQPFNYGGNWVTPVFDPGFRAWGFWLFGVWIPL